MTVNSLTNNNTELRHRLRERKLRWELLQASWIDALGLIVPMAAPLVPAFLTATAIVAYYPALLGLDVRLVIAIAIVAGAVIEILGIISIETMFDMRSFNETAVEGEESAPFQYAAAAVAFYLVLVISLVLLLKIWHGLALWSLAPLTILGFITSWVMVLRKQHGERVHRREVKQSGGADSVIVERDAEIVRLSTELVDQAANHARSIDDFNVHQNKRIEQIETAFATRLHAIQDDHNRTLEQVAQQHALDAQNTTTQHEIERSKLAAQIEALTVRLDTLTSENKRLAAQLDTGIVERPAPSRKGAGKRNATKPHGRTSEAQNVQTVLDALLLDPGCSMRSIADKMKVAPSTVLRYADLLVEQKKATKQDGKYYPVIDSPLTIPMFNKAQTINDPDPLPAPTSNGFHPQKAGE